jgi:hypothetical protein
MKFVGVTLIALVLLAASSTTHASEERSQENTNYRDAPEDHPGGRGLALGLVA